MEQNRPLVGHTINPNIPITDVAPAFPEAKVNVFLYDGKLTHRFGDRTRAVAKYRTWEEDNQTPMRIFTATTIADQRLDTTDRRNTQLSYRKTNQGLLVSHEVSRGFTANVSWEGETYSRDIRQTGRTDEDMWKVAFDLAPDPEWDVRMSYLWSDRRYDRYDNAYAESLTYPGRAFAFGTQRESQPPGHELFDQATRERGWWRFNSGWHPSEKWDLLLELNGTNDGFPTAQYGLQFDRGWAYSTQLAYNRSPRTQIWASYSFDANHRAIRSRARNPFPPPAGTFNSPLNDWFADIDEGADTYALGFHRVLKPGPVQPGPPGHPVLRALRLHGE
jgi:hypothetical protein